MSRGFIRGACALVLLAVAPAGAFAQQCTSLGPPSERRAEALRAAQLFNTAVASLHPSSPLGRRAGSYPEWSALGRAPIIAMWRGDAGQTGDLARKLQWGEDQPLPGWRVHWVADANGYAFTLTDLRDPCGFSYSSDERGNVVQGVAATGGGRVVPVDSQ